MVGENRQSHVFGTTQKQLLRTSLSSRVKGQKKSRAIAKDTRKSQ